MGRDSFAGHVAVHPKLTMPASRITATAPCRVDLAGGWTDVAPYTTEVGGAVCNIAIELRATATVTAAPRPAAPSDALMRAAWQRAGEPAVAITLDSGIPVGSGLGGSSAAGVALAAALAAWQGHELRDQALAELSRSTETETLGLAGGCQDHYASSYGGALLIECGRETTASRVRLTESTIAELERRVLVGFTGESRMSSRTITAVLDAWRAGEPQTCDALATMASLAAPMAAALDAGQIDELGRLLARQWTAQRALHPTITTPQIDRIVTETTAAGALGVKALGASGGGCVMVIARADAVDAVRRTLDAHTQPIPFRVARQGAEVRRSDDSPQDRN